MLFIIWQQQMPQNKCITVVFVSMQTHFSKNFFNQKMKKILKNNLSIN